MTPAYDDDPALKGGQKTELPDELQKAIIKKKMGKSPQRENRTMKITKRQLRNIIRESLEYKDVSEDYRWHQVTPDGDYWLASYPLGSWVYYAIIFEDWTGQYFWSFHERKGKLPRTMSTKTVRSLMKNSRLGGGKSSSLEGAKMKAEMGLDGLVLRYEDYVRKWASARNRRTEP